jgi:hypothetical protein
MTSSTATMKRDPYADLPAVPSFRLDSSLVADGETMPVNDATASHQWG